ncbi:Uncharacterised protein [Pseudomonas aeruginosa]|nr:Uncharacterised protein [Pseudomonas aeruginosa]
MAEPVVDAFLLHQPADEVETGLAVLHAVFPLAVGAAQGVLEVGEAEVAEHLLDDVRDLLVLEDAAVGGARQQPQPGAQGDLVAGELAVAGSLAASGDDAVEMPPAAVVQFQRQAGRLAQQPVEWQVGVFRDQFQLVGERPAELFATLHSLQLQDLRAERTVDPDQAGLLRKCHEIILDPRPSTGAVGAAPPKQHRRGCGGKGSCVTQIPTSAPTDGEQAEGHHERPLRARKALIREQHSVKLLSSNNSLRILGKGLTQ